MPIFKLQWGTDGEITPVACEDVEEALATVVHDIFANTIPGKRTSWVDGRVMNEAGELLDDVTVSIEPEEPPCTVDNGHDWQSPHEVVGGLKENPGVQGHGGGMTSRMVCRHCGHYRVFDSWACRTDTGEQGLFSVEYKEPDDASAAWIAGCPLK